MYAVIATGGKQYRVTADDLLRVEKRSDPVGSTIAFDEIVMIGDGDGVPPKIDGAKVTARVIAHEKSAKVVVFKKKRRKNYRRKRSHRQEMTVLRVTSIEFGGKKVTGTSKAGKATGSASTQKRAAAGSGATSASAKKAAPGVKAGGKQGAAASKKGQALGKTSPGKTSPGKTSPGKKAPVRKGEKRHGA